MLLFICLLLFVFVGIFFSKELYLTFKDMFDYGAEKIAECWVDDLEEMEEEN